MLASVAASQPRVGRWLLALAPVVTAVVLIIVFGFAERGAEGVRSATNPAVPVPGLLAAGDGGPGWTSTSAGALQAEPSGCFRPRAALLESSPRSVVGVLLTGPAGLPTVDEVAARYPSVDRAVAGFDSVATTLRSCDTFTTSAGDAAVNPIRIAVKGGRSAAARVALGAGASSAGADFVAVQRGSAVAVIVYGAGGTPDPSTVAALAARASERLGP